MTDNVVRVCKSCNSSKGGKRLYEWKGIGRRGEHNRIAEGKYLKYLYVRHERQGTLELTSIDSLCAICDLKQRCQSEGYEHKLTVYCLEGCFHKR